MRNAKPRSNKKKKATQDKTFLNSLTNKRQEFIKQKNHSVLAKLSNYRENYYSFCKVTKSFNEHINQNRLIKNEDGTWSFKSFHQRREFSIKTSHCL